jgi:gluconate 2-dehydrogenase gamma chain
MAGQNIERRDVLRVFAVAAAAGNFPGFARWSFAGAQQPGDETQPARYQPRFFTVSEYETVERLSELIIPSDGAPGAREAGVAEFIDFMVFSDTALQYPFRYGLTWLDARSASLHDRRFVELTEPQQAEILGQLAYKDRHVPGQEDGRRFFQLVRDYTVMGFYTTRIGLEELDYPGLRLYSESPACPHTGDPEHRGLAPRV